MDREAGWATVDGDARLASCHLQLPVDENPNQAGLGKTWGFPGGSDGKESALQCGRPGFDPWVRKIH